MHLPLFPWHLYIHLWRPHDSINPHIWPHPASPSIIWFIFFLRFLLFESFKHFPEWHVLWHLWIPHISNNLLQVRPHDRLSTWHGILWTIILCEVHGLLHIRVHFGQSPWWHFAAHKWPHSKTLLQILLHCGMCLVPHWNGPETKTVPQAHSTPFLYVTMHWKQ